MQGQGRAGGATVEQYSVTILDMERSSLGNGVFLVSLGSLALFQRGLRLMHANQRSGTTVGAHQMPLFGEHGQVTPHRGFRYAKGGAQLLDIGVACAYQFENGAMTINGFHGQPRGTKAD